MTVESSQFLSKCHVTELPFREGHMHLVAAYTLSDVFTWALTLPEVWCFKRGHAQILDEITFQFLHRPVTIVKYDFCSKRAGFGRLIFLLEGHTSSSSLFMFVLYCRGTHGYMAPEVIRKGVQYTFTADWFSLGCVIYKLLRGWVTHLIGGFYPPLLVPITSSWLEGFTPYLIHYIYTLLHELACNIAIVVIAQVGVV